MNKNLWQFVFFALRNNKVSCFTLFDLCINKRKIHKKYPNINICCFKYKMLKKFFKFTLDFKVSHRYNDPAWSVGRVVMQQIANLWPKFLVHRFESYTLRHKFNPPFGGFNFVPWLAWPYRVIIQAWQFVLLIFTVVDNLLFSANLICLHFKYIITKISTHLNRKGNASWR